jgi:hypothetical protein
MVNYTESTLEKGSIMAVKDLAAIVRRMAADETAVIVDRPAPPNIYAISSRDESLNYEISRQDLDGLIRHGIVELKSGERYIYVLTEYGKAGNMSSSKSVWPL